MYSNALQWRRLKERARVERALKKAGDALRIANWRLEMYDVVRGYGSFKKERTMKAERAPSWIGSKC